ncbi:MAG TPA: MaoC family dehydratase [Steroidobacteraceae bacterium]|nr:MaoC family dehydratase [Steroidobacteraceae bacterium]
MKFRDFVAEARFLAGPREVGEEEMIEFARRYDPQPFHVDPERAAASRWGGLIASGWLTCAIAMQLAVEGILAGSESIGSPGIDELRWEKPVRPGDRLILSVTVLESRVSSSGKTGIVRWRWELHNQREERVLSLLASSFFEMSMA